MSRLDGGVSGLAGEETWSFTVSWRTMMCAVVLSVLAIPPSLYRLPSMLPFDLEIYRVGIMTMLVMCALAFLTGQGVRPRRTPLDWALALIPLAVIASLAANTFDFEPTVEFPQAMKAVVYILTFVMFYYAVTSTMTSATDVESVLRFMVWTTAVVASLGVVERLTGYNIFRHLHDFIPGLQYSQLELESQLVRGGLRIAGSAEHPIGFGTMLAMVFPIAMVQVLDARDNAERARLGIAAGLIATAMFLTVSRTAALGFVVGLLVLSWGRPAARRPILIGGITLIVVLHMFFPGVLARFYEGFSPSYIQQTEVGNAAGRLEDYPRVWALFRDKPLVGRGFGTLDPTRFFWVDNQYLKLLVEVGLLGTLAFIGFFYTAASWLFHTGRGIGGGSMLVGIAASTAVFAATTATFDSFGFSQELCCFFILVSLGSALALDIDRSGTEKGEVTVA
jgi:O-antigen ligase